MSTGIKSRIPVLTTRPPSKPSFTKSAQENQSHIEEAQPKCKSFKNVAAKTLKNASEILQAPEPGKKFLSSHHARFNSQHQSKAVSKVVQTKTKSSTILDKPTKKTSTFENRKLSVASHVQNVNQAIAENNIVNRSLKGVPKQNLNQKLNKFQEKSYPEKFNSQDKSPIKKNNNIGVLVRKQSFQPDKFKKLIEQKTPKEMVPKVVVSNLSISSVEDEINDGRDSNPMSEGLSNIQVADAKENGEFGCLQPDVEFVPDERSRNQILFGQGISPALKPTKFKSSVVDRPSFFLKSKTAQRHIENLEAAKRASMLQMSGLKVRPSQASKCDPIQAVLRALENVDLAAEDRRVSTMKKNNPYYGSPKMLSPYNYKQQVDPYKTALKRIEALQMKKKAKSTKKVTFNLDSSVSNDNMKCKNMNDIKKNEKPDCRKALTFSKEEVENEETKSPCLISPPKPNETTPELKLPADSSYLVDKSERNLTPPHLMISKKEVEYEVFKEKKDPCPISPPKAKETTPELQLPANPADKPERNLTQSHYYNMLLRVCDRICSPDKQKHLNSDKLEKESKSSKQVNIKTSELAGYRNKPNNSIEPAVGGTRNSLYLQQSQPIESRRVSALRLNNPSYKKPLPTTSSITSQASSTPEFKPSLRISESVGPCFRTLSSRLAQPVREDNRYSLYLPRWQQNPSALEDSGYSLYLPRRPQPFTEDQPTRRNTLSKLITPKPISFFPKPEDQLSISPEFLCRRTSTIVAPAPISTPMVLRTMAANLEDSLSPLGFGSPSRVEDCGEVCQRLNLEDSLRPLGFGSPSRLEDCGEVCQRRLNLEDSLSPSGFGSPSRLDGGGEVCQRLDFDEEVEDRTVEEKMRVMAASPRKFCKLSFKGVLTNHQILDNLADEECMAISSFSWLPATTDRKFWNPVAQILTHGDDMHFVPVK